jgi:hypothetical protein
MLGIDEAVLRRELWPEGQAGESGRTGRNVLSFNGREVELPAGVEASQLTAVMAKRRGGQELTADERTLMRSVFQQGGGGGGGGAAGGGALRAAGSGGNLTDYLFSGDYWVIALRGTETVPVAVKTGLTDLEFSEVVAGLEPGDRVLLLPSASLYEQQERLQQFISQRFGSTTPFQQQQSGPPRFMR